MKPKLSSQLISKITIKFCKIIQFTRIQPLPFKPYIVKNVFIDLLPNPACVGTVVLDEIHVGVIRQTLHLLKLAANLILSYARYNNYSKASIMAFPRSSSILFSIFVLLAVLVNPTISSRASSFIKLPRSSIASYCESWRLASETNNAGTWKVVPSKCENYVKNYINGGQFDQDYDVVANYAIAYANTIKLESNGMDAWVFDIDETLLSNLEYYKAHGYG